MDSFSIRVYKQYFNFSAAHFLIFENGEREPIHGHNYKVAIKGTTKQLQSDMVFDFLDIKPIVKEVCDSLDHLLLIPSEHPTLKIDQRDSQIELTCPDGARFSFPAQDVLLLPLPNISAERLSIFIGQEIKKKVSERFQFQFSSLDVEVEETPGQSAITTVQGDS